jgi:branched-chain amino acid transport system permease protein
VADSTADLDLPVVVMDTAPAAILGATLAGFILGFIEIFVAMVFPSTLRDFIAYSIILLILVFRPYGLFGEPYSVRLRL